MDSSFLPSLSLFSFSRRAYKEHPAKRPPEVNDPGGVGPRQEGRPPTKKYLDSAYEPALVARDYACIRRIPGTLPAPPDCNQVKMDCFTSAADSAMLRGYRHDEYTFRICLFYFSLVDESKIERGTLIVMRRRAGILRH